MKNIFTRSVFAVLVVVCGLGSIGLVSIAHATVASTIFSDGFESNNFNNWTVSASTQWSIEISSPQANSGSHRAIVHGADTDDSITRTESTAGFQNISLIYSYKVEQDLESNDHVRVEWSLDGSSWTQLFDITNVGSSNSWTQKTHALPSSANNASGFRFRIRSTQDSNGNDRVAFDDISLVGSRIPANTGSISGMKFNDVNGNGARDAGEPGLPNWTISLLGAVATSTVTDASGNYSFAHLQDGSYTVCESLVAGWSQTFPLAGASCAANTKGYSASVSGGNAVTGQDFGNVQLGSIRIQKITDPSDAGGVFPFTVSGNGTTSIASVEGEGSTVFGNLLPGTYSITENVPTGWDFSSATCGNESLNNFANGGNYVVDPGENVVCTFHDTKRSSITITKIADPADGSFTFTLSGGASTPDPVTFTDGEFPGGTNSYTFDNIIPGSSYSISEGVPDGWSGQMTSICTLGESQFSPSLINLPAGRNVSCVFNNTEFGSISGKKFGDENANGINDDEAGISGWTISLSGADDFATTTVTNADGLYLFSNLLPGTYHVCEASQDGWHQSYPAEGNYCDNGNGYEVTLSGGGQSVGGKDFGNYENGSLIGGVFNDANNNGNWDDNELSLEAWTVRFYDTTGATLLGEYITGDNGHYLFNVKPDTYVVKEVHQDEWTQTEPADFYSITISSGETSGENNFGNFQASTGTIGGSSNGDDGITTPTSTTPTSTPPADNTDNTGGGGGGNTGGTGSTGGGGTGYFLPPTTGGGGAGGGTQPSDTELAPNGNTGGGANEPVVTALFTPPVGGGNPPVGGQGGNAQGGGNNGGGIDQGNNGGIGAGGNATSAVLAVQNLQSGGTPPPAEPPSALLASVSNLLTFGTGNNGIGFIAFFLFLLLLFYAGKKVKEYVASEV